MNNLVNRIFGRRVSHTIETPHVNINTVQQRADKAPSECIKTAMATELTAHHGIKERERFFLTRSADSSSNSLNSLNSLNQTNLSSQTSPEMSPVQHIESANHIAQPARWREQLAMVRDAYYSPGLNAGKEDPCTRDYCYHRANVLSAMIVKSNSAQVIGWIEGTTIIGQNKIASPDTFDYHIAALVRDKGTTYIADPLHEGLEARSQLDVEEWTRLTIGSGGDQAMEYRFITPTAGNFAGMRTDHIKAMDAGEFESTINNYHGPVLQETFADSQMIDDGLISLAIFKSAIADYGSTDPFEGKAVVRANSPDGNNKKDFLWKKPFSLTLPHKNGAQVSDKGHCNEVIAVMNELGRPISEKIII
ncbi:hypothetical protein [Actimicrobium sp. CCI2.3]|uniref:hypothetical protein n=1 Tax=Actimicrobium sp. CCI2.3 TaxID=3048616 RepID=UPI002AB3736E|nr:hypothetical protein [Actimicrobium sp. CCI2.3]MDY7574873.1 hypothetical protein [Actimicrobium sp. CCI2.3]MEB0020166.1 hypothetical protein [Actimicrobium sp. CCI2.3]